MYGFYVRVSTEDQARNEEGSLRSQLQRLKEFLKSKGEKNNYTIYEDRGISGKNTNRPAFQKMLTDVKGGLLHTILCTELSRVSRSVIDFYNFLQYCESYKVGLVCLRERFDTTEAHGRLMLGIFSVFAQFEREQISERVSANMNARARRGLFNGGYVYGYRPRPDKKGYLDIDHQEALMIRLIYDKYLELGSIFQVTKYLADKGYKTREYTTAGGKYRIAKHFCQATISNILQNPAYVGKRRVDNKIINAVWDKIVDEDKWLQVQDLIARNNKNRKNNTKSNSQHTYLLSNLVWCSECNCFLENGSGTGKLGKIYFYYRHKGKRSNNCTQPASFPAQELEQFVYMQIISLLDEENTLLNSIIEEIDQETNAKVDNLNNQIDWIKKRIKELDRESQGLVSRLCLLAQDQVHEFITPRLEEISTNKKQLEQQNQQLVRELVEMQNEVVESKDVYSIIQSFKDGFTNLDKRQQQQILTLLIERIEILAGQIIVILRINSNNNDSSTKQAKKNLSKPECSSSGFKETLNQMGEAGLEPARS